METAYIQDTLVCRPLYPLIFVSNQPSLRWLATTNDKFQSPSKTYIQLKIGVHGDHFNRLSLSYESTLNLQARAHKIGG